MDDFKKREALAVAEARLDHLLTDMAGDEWADTPLDEKIRVVWGVCHGVYYDLENYRVPGDIVRTKGPFAYTNFPCEEPPKKMSAAEMLRLCSDTRGGR